MYVDPKSTICGFRALKVRDCLYRSNGDPVGADFFAYYLHISKSRAGNLIQELVARRYLSPFKQQGWRGSWYRTTLKGAALSMASGTPPITRKTAERLVAQLLERVKAANAGDYFLYRVSRVVVFGSYLTDAPRLNDIDVAIDLEKRFPHGDEQQRRIWQRVGESDRTFRNVIDKISWPTKELYMFLKGGSRSFSIHTFDDQILRRVAQRQIYP